MIMYNTNTTTNQSNQARPSLHLPILPLRFWFWWWGNYVLLGSIYLDSLFLLLVCVPPHAPARPDFLLGGTGTFTAGTVVSSILVNTSSLKSTSTHFQSSSSGSSGLSSSCASAPETCPDGSYLRLKEVLMLMWLANCVAGTGRGT